ncbi:hypothetical protein ASG43_20570 [Aureimonas sp. Leaf454]|uniref:hypothetical protein n=1 Tax=Aureimonas sp. Leaf454 TaxID=1736381 RepID=UPI0006FB0355|nr:hypothetical protein [Aureimonas sp. Leaf454]KQT51977.1 hypothetical protein ASG43_20570 [Aureimonas sp. Leaf454]
MSQNCMILFPNRADPAKGALPGAVLSGPTWALPLSNLQTRRLSQVARSLNTQPANTFFNVAMGGERQIKALALIRHNLTVTASWRIRAWYTADGIANPVYDVTEDVYPSLGFTEDLPWESEAWWDGKPLSEELEGYTQLGIHIIPDYVSAPNWRIEIFDQNNPAGFVEAGRLFMADGWQPSQNYAYGGSHGVETKTSVEESLSGAEFFDRRQPYRVARIGFEYLDQDEALLKGLDLQRRAGTDAEVLWIASPGNRRTLTQTSFIGRFRQLSAWEQVVFERANIAFEIKELL